MGITCLCAKIVGLLRGQSISTMRLKGYGVTEYGENLGHGARSVSSMSWADLRRARKRGGVEKLGFRQRRGNLAVLRQEFIIQSEAAEYMFSLGLGPIKHRSIKLIA